MNRTRKASRLFFTHSFSFLFFVFLFGFFLIVEGCSPNKTQEPKNEQKTKREFVGEERLQNAEETQTSLDASLPPEKHILSETRVRETSKAKDTLSHDQTEQSTLPEKRRPPESKLPPTKKPQLGGCQIFPSDNPWNRDISKEPVDPNSRKILASIGLNTGLHPDFGTKWKGVPNGIPYVIVPASQKKVKITFRYKDESDPSPYPVPTNAPIEGGSKGNGDRHVLVLQKSHCKLYELFNAHLQSDGSWKAGSGAVFDLSSNKLRPDTWTSADAAGLPILPGLVRYEEVVKGEIRHALRFTVVRSRKAYVHPATHWASSKTATNLPPMGMRVRLKASVDISSYPKNIQVILRAMKKYGMFVADNGSNWYVSGAPNPKWDDDELRSLRKIKGKDFEVIKMGKIYKP